MPDREHDRGRSGRKLWGAAISVLLLLAASVFCLQLVQMKRARTTRELANAAYLAKNYPEAERLALQAADQTRKAVFVISHDALEALILAGLAAREQVGFTRAIEHLRAAEQFGDRQRTPVDWAEVQQAMAEVLIQQGRYKEAETILQSVAEMRARLIGPEHADTLASRMYLASTQLGQGRYRQAEADYRAVLELQSKVLGPEHPGTLKRVAGQSARF